MSSPSSLTVVEFHRESLITVEEYSLETRLLPHHNNVRTTTVVVVVVHTPHSFPKNDRTRTVIRTSKCTVQMAKRFLKN